MPDGLAGLLHDTSLLYRFADFFEEYCKEQERSQTYGGPSSAFFKYVRSLTSGIKQLGKGIESQKRPGNLRSRVLLAKSYMGLLHALIKPAADAHTLTIPAPLINMASRQLRSLPGMEDSNVVILLTPEFMYFQRPHSGIKDKARRIGRFIPKAQFPKKLGFIELPYSQGSNFFTNLAIYHEIGHFVYEELSQTRPDLVTLLKTAKENCVTQASGRNRRDRQTVALARKTVEYWIQEIFCDLFAVRLVGPAFSLAIIEIFGMLGVLHKEEKILTFDLEHPAPACRIAEHLKILQADSWWTALSESQSSQKNLIERFAKIKHSEYRFYAGHRTLKSHSLIMEFVRIVIPTVEQVVRQITPQPKLAVEDFKKHRHTIEECFRAGVVPHTNDETSLDPVSIINSALCFYLTELPALIEDFDGVGAKNDVEKYSEWAKRLEMWTMKAIDDSLIRGEFKRNEELWSSLEKKS